MSTFRDKINTRNARTHKLHAGGMKIAAGSPRKKSALPELSSQVVFTIAYMLLVQKQSYEDCVEAFKYQEVTRDQIIAVREARLSRDHWIGAIVKLGRERLIK